MHRIHHANGVVTMTFESLDGLPLRAHVSTRHGGVSPEPWATLNFSVKRGDLPERVRENRTRFAAAVGVNSDRLVSCQQVHGTGIARVEGDAAGQLQMGCDGLITDAVGLPLSLVFADCVPVLLYDRHHHALGICHAGWRGTVHGVAAATLWAMQAAYDSDPADVQVCIGPSIGPDSYEVGEDVIALAEAKLPNARDLLLWNGDPKARPHFDLWKANASQLAALGVRPERIQVSGIDTAQHTQDFFSHRAEQGRCGLFGMLAWLADRT